LFDKLQTICPPRRRQWGLPGRGTGPLSAASAQAPGHGLEARLQPLIAVDLRLQLVDPLLQSPDALLQLPVLDPEPVRLGDLDLVAEDHLVGRPQRRRRAVGPARLERAPAALAEHAVE